MKHEVENLDGHFKKISIEIPVDSVKAEFEKTYRDIQKEAELKGFRKGKAPLSVIVKTYSGMAQDHVARNLVEKFLPEALKENSLQPAHSPRVDFLPVKDSDSFKFTAQFENMPPVNMKNYQGFASKKPTSVDVSEEEISTTLSHIQERLSTFEDAPETEIIGTTSFARIKIKASEAGIDVPDVGGDSLFINAAENYFGKEFCKNIAGLKKGDTKSFTVKYEESHQAFPNKTYDFDVEILAVVSRKTPEWTEENLKKIGPFETLESLKTRVTDDLKKEKETRLKNDIKEEFIDWLISENPVDAPQTLVNQQVEYLATEAARNLSQMALPQDQIEQRLKEWQSEMETRALRQVKASLLLSEIASKENIQASQEDIRDEIVRYAMQEQRKPQELLEELRSKGMLPGLAKQLTELKTLDVFAGKALKKDEQ
ncbi:MAG: trigger factor [Proteobacteria bacterium]|nr:trigger factor [Pseudomonadota bacterium]